MTAASTPTRPPWTIEYSVLDGWSIWHDPRVHGDMRRGAVVVANLGHGKDAEANARLIAAAPDLFAVLKFAERALSASAWLGCPDTGPDAGIALDKIRVAIKAAACAPG